MDRYSNDYIQELNEIFVEVPLYNIPWFDCEISGIKGVKTIASEVMSKWDVFDAKDIHKGLSYEAVEEGYLLKLFAIS